MGEAAARVRNAGAVFVIADRARSMTLAEVAGRMTQDVISASAFVNPGSTDYADWWEAADADSFKPRIDLDAKRTSLHHKAELKEA